MTRAASQTPPQSDAQAQATPAETAAANRSLLYQLVCSCSESTCPRRTEVDRALTQAWIEGYVAGNAFGYEYAQDTYDGPLDDPTPNPYEPTETHQ